MEMTKHLKKGEIVREWWTIDAEGKTLGRLASKVASLLRGKHKPTFSPFLDVGDFVIVVNAEKIRVTGKKMRQKLYRYHAGYLGNLKEFTLEEMLKRKPEEIIKEAVSGMLPKNRLGRKIFRKLKVYRGPSHPHSAQNPKVFEWN
ncbi:MAG: 50S ribosomal protein L13 [Candidatus Aminicenantia bacterium]